MRALVIGASGQVGGHLLEQLNARGHAAVGTRFTSTKSQLPRLDIAEPERVREAIRDVEADAVLLPAGFTWVDGCEKDPARSRRENVELPLAVARLAAEVGAVFVWYSTDYVFDGARGPYSEDDETSPLQVYGHDKLACERAILAEKLPALLLRTTTVYGPEEQGRNFVLQLVAKARAGERLKVANDQVATPAYSPDVATATIELLEARARGVVNLAGPDFIDRAKFGQLACEILGLDARTIEPVTTDVQAKTAARRPLLAGLKADRLFELTGYRIRGARAGLEAVREWLARKS